MTHWFHRNPLKATAPQDFDVKKISMKADFTKVMSDLRQARRKLLAGLSDPTTATDLMKSLSDEYFSLLLGLVNAPETPQKKEPPKAENSGEKLDQEMGEMDVSESKLKTFFRFKWSQSLWISNPPVAQNDVEYELLNMGINLGIWHTKYAARAADKPELKDDDAKEVFRNLKIAAGIFQEFRENRVGRLATEGEKTSDLDYKVLDCYIVCTQAEAQEVTLARAVELNHKNNLIASLAFETAKCFEKADGHLKALEQPVVLKWRKYLQLKQAFYKAYAYCYHGETLLSQEKCGDAIKCLTESQQLSESCFTLCRDYISTKGAGSTVRPHEHPFYQRLVKRVKLTLDKVQRENSFIYFQKVPEVVPELDLKAQYGIVQPEPYCIPSTHDSWKQEVYAGYSISKNVDTSKKGKSSTKDADVVPVKEADIKVTRGTDCVIS